MLNSLRSYLKVSLKPALLLALCGELCVIFASTLALFAVSTRVSNDLAFMTFGVLNSMFFFVLLGYVLLYPWIRQQVGEYPRGIRIILYGLMLLCLLCVLLLVMWSVGFLPSVISHFWEFMEHVDPFYQTIWYLNPRRIYSVTSLSVIAALLLYLFCGVVACELSRIPRVLLYGVTQTATVILLMCVTLPLLYVTRVALYMLHEIPLVYMLLITGDLGVAGLWAILFSDRKSLEKGILRRVTYILLGCGILSALITMCLSVIAGIITYSFFLMVSFPALLSILLLGAVYGIKKKLRYSQ